MQQLVNFLKVILFVSVFAVLNINCKSKNKGTSTPYSINPESTAKTSITVENISGVYTITGATMNTNGKEEDVYSQFNECGKKAAYGFNKDMVWYLGGVALQDCTGPDESGTWSLSGNNLTINSRQSGTYEYTITDFDGKVMVAQSQAEDNGVKQTMITTFTKKQ